VRAAGIYGSLIGFGLGVTVGDVNGIYIRIFIYLMILKRIIYTSIIKWNLYRTNTRMGISHSQSSMGADMADVITMVRPTYL
jgi:hypothetical protein